MTSTRPKRIPARSGQTLLERHVLEKVNLAFLKFIAIGGTFNPLDNLHATKKFIQAEESCCEAHEAYV